MSVVGPRPALFNQHDLVSQRSERGVDRLLPGLTGWAQINGRNALAWDEKFALDVWYVDHQSLGLDLRILACTLWKVLRPQGISHAGEATMSEFRGRSDRYESIQVHACRTTKGAKEVVPF